MCSAMLQCPKSSPKCLLGAQRACPAAATAQQPLGNVLSNRGDPAQGMWGHHLIAVLSCRSKAKMGDAGPAPTPIPVGADPLAGGTWGPCSTRLGAPGASASSRGPHTSAEALLAHGGPGPRCPHVPQLGSVSGCPHGTSSPLPGLAYSVSFHLAPVNNSPPLSPLFPCRYL